jgi:membrane fusion protein, copper/silver efflux system
MNEIFLERTLQKQNGGRSVRALAWSAGVITVLSAGLVLGFQFGNRWPMPVARELASAAKSDAPVLYYRHPGGKPLYSLAPAASEDGRSYLPVHAGEDFEFASRPASSPPAAAGPRRILYYRNPMGLPDTSPVPKKDSMGMDYIPVYEGEADDASIVTLGPGKLQRTGVRSEMAEKRIVSRRIRAPGTVQLDERRVSIVATRSESFIDRVENVTTGDRVRKGQFLLRLYSPEVNAAAAQLIANPGFDGSRRRLQNLNVPEDVISEMERTRKVPLSIEWSSPRDGVVLERNAVDGMRAGAGDVLFRIADLSVVWVLADVPEHALGDIRPGQRVTIKVRSLPGREFDGKVALVYPQVRKETRTTPVRIELQNPEGLLLPDMYADVEIASGASQPVLAVPDGAVIDSGERQFVIVDKGEGRFEPKDVQLGSRGGGFVAIRSGISEGDRVVTAANFLIDSESNLKAALQGLAASRPGPAQEKPR